MATPGEGLLGREFLFEFSDTAGVYTFTLRCADSPSTPAWSVVEVLDPNGVRTSAYPASLCTYITDCMDFLAAAESPTFDVSPLTLAFEAVDSGPSPPAQIVTVVNGGDFASLLSWVCSADQTWGGVAPEECGGIRQSTGTDVSLAVATEDLPIGTHTVSWVFTDPAATAPTAAVTGTVVIIPKAEISLSVSSLVFTATYGGSSPPDQTFLVTNTGPAGSKLRFTAGVTSSTATWITVTPTSGGPLASTEFTVLTVRASVGSLRVGTYRATVVVTDETASNNPQTVAVTLVVS
jgi:hypothetical protein